jgi:2-dehydro-3-deoxygalactonokinase
VIRSPLIGVDWGSSRLRAWLVDRDGSEIARASADVGILVDRPDDLRACLTELLRPWAPMAPSVAMGIGMIGSRTGIVDAGYLEAPAGRREWSREWRDGGSVAGIPLRVFGGVVSRNAEGVDLMRGEEFLAFAVRSIHMGTVVLPGTHSKWLDLTADTINGLRTFVTGELFRVWSTAPWFAGFGPGTKRRAAFGVGLEIAHTFPDTLQALFQIRAGVMSGLHDPSDAGEILSGLLIGREVIAGLGGSTQRVAIVAEPNLAGRYVRAFERSGVAADVLYPDVCWAFARLATESAVP